VIEDILVRLDALPAADLDPWRSLALRCLGPDDARPPDGTALLRAMP
jgi:serine/threonine-protein kinase